MLNFRRDGTFTIVQLTDLHWKDGGTDDTCTQDLVRQILIAERPDLVIITGDVIDKKECRDPLRSFEIALESVCESGIPWAFVFGNHEYECGTDPLLFAALLKRLPNCLYEMGPENVRGYSNYSLPIYGSHSVSVEAVLYLLDSGSKTNMDFGGSDWIHWSQIAWYRSESEQFRVKHGEEPLPSLAFFHIPLPEYDEVWTHHVCFGNKFKKVSSPKVNSGLFASMVEMGDVMGTFVGHCHLNDYYGELHGIRLCYARLSGIGAKGPIGYARGARVIRLYEGERAFDVWQRLEGGVMLDKQPEHTPDGIHVLLQEFKE
ncbi:metallophosphoesterase family protein [Paenibacillus sp. LjRoot56]|uniref:metallophosphoesterase family protein n=1 Tax=Paenibacillus sp. LjRoot56 TaxID=3342333 RepID=UPI003ECF6048